MQWNTMSSIVLHVWPKDIHSLSLNPGSMGDVPIYASIKACDTILHNCYHRSVRYIPWNIISIAARDSTLEMIHPYTTIISQDTMQLTCSNENEEITILITKHDLQPGIEDQQISNKSASHSQHHTKKYTNFIRLTRV